MNFHLPYQKRMENKGKERQLHKTAVQISDMYESSAMFDRLSEFVDDTKVEKPLYKISAYTSGCFGFSVLCTLSPKMGKVGVWKASYYCNKTKTWIYGHLVIYTRCIRFVEEKGRKKLRRFSNIL